MSNPFMAMKMDGIKEYGVGGSVSVFMVYFWVFPAIAMWRFSIDAHNFAHSNAYHNDIGNYILLYLIPGVNYLVLGLEALIVLFDDPGIFFEVLFLWGFGGFLFAFMIGGMIGGMIDIYDWGQKRAVIFVSSILVCITYLFFFPFLLVISLFAVAPALITVLILQTTMLKQKLSGLESAISFNKLMEVDIRGNEIKYSFNHSEVGEYSYSGNVIFNLVSALVGIIITYIMIRTEKASGALRGIPFYDDQLSEDTTYVLVFIASAILLFISASFVIKTKEQILSAVVERLVDMVSKATTVLNGKTLNQLLITHRRLSSELEIPSREDELIKPMYDYAATNKFELLSSPEMLNNIVSGIENKILKDNQNLTTAKNQLDKVMQSYQKTALLVNRAGNNTMFDLLDQLRLGIDGIKQFLAARELEKFNRGLQFVTDELASLQKNAAAPVAPVETESPWDVLRIEEGTPIETVENVYKRLRQIYHPDKGHVQDHTEITKIQAAYEEIVRRYSA